MTIEGERADEAPAVQTETLRFPSAFAFVGSGCVLVLELVAGRLLAPSIGVSLYTWTSIIGVVLAGISLGNYLGGRLADKRPGRATLATLYFFSALASSIILAFTRNLSAVDAPESWPAIAQVVWLATLLFLAPSLLLGMITPMLVKLSLSSLGETGRVVGRIQAAATMGGIVGTFATGFWLISAFGTRAIVAGVAGALLVLGVLSVPRWTTQRRTDVVAIVVFVGVMIGVSSTDCLEESNYFCIRVTDGSEPNVKVLTLDYLEHGYVDLTDPTNLIYPYEKLYEELLTAAYTPGKRVDSFSIGGGSYTFPRWLEQRYGGRVVVSEIDPAVTAVARTHLGLKPGPRMRIIHEDARRVVQRMGPEERFDVILQDAFNDLSVPYHLTTREFGEMVAAHLVPGGIYVANVVDGVRYDFLRAYVYTLQKVFPHVRLLRTPEGWPPTGGRRTFVVAASDAPLPEVPSMVPVEEAEAFLSDRMPALLTDDHVPADQLLAPVFRQRLEG